MRIRRITIERFRGVEQLELMPGPRTVILGPNNTGKSTVFEALDLLLHPGFGRSRPAPTSIDYFGRDPSAGFRVEAVLGDLSQAFLAEARDCLEGWRADGQELIPDPDGDGVEAVARVQVVGSTDFDISHEFSKPEVAGTRFHPRLRAMVNWVFDGRSRDPARQLAFYQGGLLDRLFRGTDLGPALGTLKTALDEGAQSMNADAGIDAILSLLGRDLSQLGLIGAEQLPAFEAGLVSERELLQTLRIGLPTEGGVRIPLAAQGRGTQRLVLVAVLLRLAQANGDPVIGAFEEPEEALEPLRQGQLARMMAQTADSGGQVFIVTHSPEIVRAFLVDDIVIIHGPRAGASVMPLRTVLSPKTRQAYERHLDGALARALFAPVPFLVEGPTDRAVFEVFWQALAVSGAVLPAHQLGLEPVNCESYENQPKLAALLHEAGKAVAAWVERDDPRAFTRLKGEGHCSALLLYPADSSSDNLERSLSREASLDGLTKALSALAEDQGYTWEQQRNDLVSRCGSCDIGADMRDQIKAADSLVTLLKSLPDNVARTLIASALIGGTMAPFSMKGGRQGRIVAEAITAADGVPGSFAASFKELARWVQDGCTKGAQIEMNVA